MSISVWLDDPIPCSAKVVGKNFEKVKSVDFVFRVGSTEVGRAKGTIVDGIAKCDWEKAAGPPEGKLFAFVRYCLELQGKKYDNFPEVIRVCRKQLTVVVTNADKKPVRNALCTLTQIVPEGFPDKDSVKTVQRKSGEDGKIVFDLMYPADVKLTFNKPFVLEQWLKQDADEWHAQVKGVPYEMDLVWPLPGALHKQLVNLDPSPSEPAAGQILTVKVKARKPDLALKGDTAYLHADFGDHNEKRRPLPKGNPGPGKSCDLKAELQDDLTATFKLDLGPSGGDVVKLKIGSTPECKDGEVEVQTWRRLQYQVSARATATLPAVKDYVDPYEKAFVELVRVNEKAEIPPDHGQKGSWIDAYALGAGGGDKRLVVGPHNRDAFDDLRQPPADLHLLACDYYMKQSAAQTTMPALAADQVTWPDGNKVAGQKISAVAIGGAGKVLIGASIDSGGDSIQACSWEITKAPKDSGHDGKKGDFAKGDRIVHITGGNLRTGALYVRYPKDLRDLLDAGCEALVTVSATVVEVPNGCSRGPRILLALSNSSGPRSLPGLAGTLVHEVGHAVKMTLNNDYKVPGIADPRPAHGRWYTARGHQGNHCADGVDEALFNDATKLLTGQKGSCVMYGEGWDGRPRTFCKRCLPYLLPIEMKNLWT